MGGVGGVDGVGGCAGRAQQAGPHVFQQLLQRAPLAALACRTAPQSETAALAASWDPFQDDETGVAGYAYQVGARRRRRARARDAWRAKENNLSVCCRTGCCLHCSARRHPACSPTLAHCSPARRSLSLCAARAGPRATWGSPSPTRRRWGAEGRGAWGRGPGRGGAGGRTQRSVLTCAPAPLPTHPCCFTHPSRTHLSPHPLQHHTTQLYFDPSQDEFRVYVINLRLWVGGVFFMRVYARNGAGLEGFRWGGRRGQLDGCCAMRG